MVTKTERRERVLRTNILGATAYNPRRCLTDDAGQRSRVHQALSQAPVYVNHLIFRALMRLALLILLPFYRQQS